MSNRQDQRLKMAESVELPGAGLQPAIVRNYGTDNILKHGT